MAILIVCACGRLQRVPYSYNGREIRCLACGAPIFVSLNKEEIPEAEKTTVSKE